MRRKIKEIKIYTDNTFGLKVKKNTYNDELIIIEESIECKRYFVVLDEYIMWKHTFLNDTFKDSFIKLCKMFKNLNKPVIAGCDTPITTITLKYDDESVLEEEYTGSLSDNDMTELSVELLKIIPSGCFYPKFFK